MSGGLARCGQVRTRGVGVKIGRFFADVLYARPPKPSVQQQKMLVLNLKRPVLFAEQINPVSCFAAECSVARPGMLTTEVTSSVKYDGARPLMAWCTKIQNLKFIRSEIGNQCSSYRAGDTWSRGFKSMTNRAAALRTL